MFSLTNFTTLNILSNSVFLSFFFYFTNNDNKPQCCPCKSHNKDAQKSNLVWPEHCQLITYKCFWKYTKHFSKLVHLIPHIIIVYFNFYFRFHKHKLLFSQHLTTASTSNKKYFNCFVHCSDKSVRAECYSPEKSLQNMNTTSIVQRMKKWKQQKLHHTPYPLLSTKMKLAHHPQ